LADIISIHHDIVDIEPILAIVGSTITGSFDRDSEKIFSLLFWQILVIQIIIVGSFQFDASIPITVLANLVFHGLAIAILIESVVITSRCHGILLLFRWNQGRRDRGSLASSSNHGRATARNHGRTLAFELRGSIPTLGAISYKIFQDGWMQALFFVVLQFQVATSHLDLNGLWFHNYARYIGTIHQRNLVARVIDCALVTVVHVINGDQTGLGTTIRQDFDVVVFVSWPPRVASTVIVVIHGQCRCTLFAGSSLVGGDLIGLVHSITVAAFYLTKRLVFGFCVLVACCSWTIAQERNNKKKKHR